MSKATSRLHGLIGDYMREIDKIKTKAQLPEKNLTAGQLGRIRQLRKLITDTAKSLQKGW
jgi:hypothetical protein